MIECSRVLLTMVHHPLQCTLHASWQSFRFKRLKWAHIEHQLFERVHDVRVQLLDSSHNADSETCLATLKMEVVNLQKSMREVEQLVPNLLWRVQSIEAHIIFQYALLAALSMRRPAKSQCGAP